MPSITKEGLLIEQFVDHIPKSVVDFGARLLGSNSWHLVTNHGFSGLMVERNKKSAAKLRNRLKAARTLEMSVTPENVNELVPEDIGVLCIDIDGNDYWIWKALKAKASIVVIEVGKPWNILEQTANPESWIAPYDPESKKRLHGTSEEMMVQLGHLKGYRVYQKIGVNLVFLHETLYSSGAVALHPST